MDKEEFNTEQLLQELGGCGLFQVLLMMILLINNIPYTFTYLIDSYGIYNPGWRCLNTTTNFTKTITTGNQTILLSAADWNTSDIYRNDTDSSLTGSSRTNTSEYGIHSCQAFQSCSHVEFKPSVSTFVSDWHLICNRGWMLSTILSLAMAGGVVATPIAGYIGDRFGRKIPFVFSKISIAVLSIVAMFSVSWEMYACLAFLQGVATAFTIVAPVLMVEYVPESWRMKISCVPDWNIVGIAFAAIAMFIENWRTLKLIQSILGFLFVILVYWLPNSLRWLLVKGKKEEAMKIIKLMAKVNKTKSPDQENIDSLMADKSNKEKESSKSTKSSSIIDLFRKGYRLKTIVVGFISLSADFIYFSFSFSVLVLPGNVYVNMIISNVTEVPSKLIAFFLASRFPRKKCCFILFILGAVGITGMLILDQTATGDLRNYGIVALVMLVKLFMYITYVVVSTVMVEMYPTVVRTSVKSYSYLGTSIGGLLAPYMIPSDPDDFYINCIAMGTLCTLCTGLVYFLTETKGKPLMDNWDDKPKESEINGSNEKKEKNLIV